MGAVENIMQRPLFIGSVIVALAVVATYAVGGISAVSAPDDYSVLEQPTWAPPAWLFGPVWSVLYIMIAVAGIAALHKLDGKFKNKEMTMFGVQLFFNALWTPLFFAWGLRGLSFFWILVLDGLVVLTILYFWRLRPWIGALMIPYLAWICFASALNGSMWLLNR